MYLGSLISKDGQPDSEISRRIGMATADFQALKQLWSHASVNKQDKLRYFNSLVVSRLLYGLSTLWLVSAQKRRLDGFYCRCLRRILRIPSAYHSRVSNATVFARAGVKSLSSQLLDKQVSLLERVARAPAANPIRQCTFVGDSVRPQMDVSQTWPPKTGLDHRSA